MTELYILGGFASFFLLYDIFFTEHTNDLSIDDILKEHNRVIDEVLQELKK